MKTRTLILSALFSLAALQAGAVEPRDRVVIEGPAVRLADLFSGLGSSAGRKEVAEAPAPGERTVFGPRDLTRLADAHSVGWRPGSSGYPRVVVEREAVDLDAARAAALVEKELARLLPGFDYTVDLDQHGTIAHLPVDAGLAGATVLEASADESARRVRAVLAVADGHGGDRRIAVTGDLHRVVDLPVLSRAVMAGDRITRDDVETLRVRADRLRRGVVTNEDHLIGRTPRRTLRPSHPILAREIQDVMAIERRTLVTIVYEVPGMRLTARGRAEEAGAIGDSIRVLNTQSDTTIEARVERPGLVSVAPDSNTIGPAGGAAR